MISMVEVQNGNIWGGGKVCVCVCVCVGGVLKRGQSAAVCKL